MFNQYLTRVISGETLDQNEAYNAAKMLLHDHIAPVKAAAFLSSMRTRKETTPELQGFVQAIYEEAVRLESPAELLDTCGTGGDHMGTFNISTAAAIVVAACGVPVAKHGNTAATSAVGSADVLEALGMNIRMSQDHARHLLDEAGITFLFAPFYHPILKEVGPLRREMGIATIFNFLGPMLNPFELSFQVMGISDSSLQNPIATTLSDLGRDKAMVIHAENGMDEVSPFCSTRVVECNREAMKSYVVDPHLYGISSFELAAIKGGDREANASIINSVLKGQTGPHRETVLLNSGMALLAANRCESLEDAIQVAGEAIDSGKASAVLQKMISFSREAC